MLQSVDVRSVAGYRGVAPDDILDQLDSLARQLRGLCVLQLNAIP